MFEFIDISAWTEFTNYPKVASQKTGCLIKTGQDYWQDSKFTSHWQGAGAAGMARGVWHFYQPDQSYQRQVDGFLRIYNSIPGWKPRVVFLDCEEIWYLSGGEYVVVQPPGRTAYTHWIAQWLQRVHQTTGYLPGVYTRKSFWDQWVYAPGTRYYFDGTWYTAPDWSQYPLWVANYHVSTPALPRDWKTWDFWQYSGDEAQIPGIASEVDLDYCVWSQDKVDALMREPQEPPPPMTNTVYLPQVNR